MSASHGLRFDGSRFWVIHRQQEYGPFDYQWSTDLRGLEMIYQGEKFGEHCSENQIYADLDFTSMDEARTGIPVGFQRRRDVYSLKEV